MHSLRCPTVLPHFYKSFALIQEVVYQVTQYGFSDRVPKKGPTLVGPIADNPNGYVV